METTKINDIINNIILPSIAKGATISKDYTLDLIHRTMYCLIIQDIITVILMLVIFILMILSIIKKIKKRNKNNEDDIAPNIAVNTISLIIFGMFTYVSILNLVQDLTIPEVRIYQFYKQVTLPNN